MLALLLPNKGATHVAAIVTFEALHTLTLTKECCTLSLSQTNRTLSLTQAHRTMTLEK